MKRLLKLLVLLPLALRSLTYAQADFTDIQTFIDSTITRNFINTTFDNNLLAANLISRLNFYGTHKRFNFYMKNFYSSSVTKLTENLYRDFDNIKTGVGYNVNDNLNVSVNYLGQFFADDKSFQLEGTSSNMGYVSAAYDGVLSDARTYSVLNAGYKTEDQIGEYNKGPTAFGEFNIYSLNVSDFIVDGQLRLGYESLDPRKKSLAYTRLYIERSFDNDLARNEFDGMFSRIRKDFYFPADIITEQQYGVNNNIEKRIETIARFFDRFDYTISNHLDMFLTIAPYYRKITKENNYIPSTPTLAPSIYDTDIHEFNAAGDVALNFNYDSWNYQIKATYRERDEKHFLLNPNRISQNFVDIIADREATKNNHSSIFQLNSSLYYNLNLMHRIELLGNASIVKYDTPSDDNFDDRDELGYIIYLGHRFNNLKNLIITNSFDLNMYHTVYIFAQKSSNNNWNRVLRFTSKSFFTPADWFRNVGTFSVLANYTVYDFEDIISSVQSYSFRQLNLRDSAIVNFTRHLGIDVYGELKLYERGELNWGEFSQRPISYFEDKIINSELNYFFNNFIILSAGYKYFEQKRYNYVDGERVFDNFIKTTGPFARLRVWWKQNSAIEVLGSYDYYEYGDETPDIRNGNIYINAVWNF